jgi:hypothetical protein
MVALDYDTPAGPVKAYYQTQTTNGSLGYFENFMGDQGTLLISSRKRTQPRSTATRTHLPGIRGSRRDTSQRPRSRR